ncbi:hypothetical protein BDD43_3760 [Mucilaginibacter gracilis]|uniref:Erythromycin esterase n=2 Tax=Mucilaginibacter gracilis TaxID=423350 RepID=A0A495J3K5_9SPHI|nr:hypothetical protein BDD43_3760 [Mucilaginibacter gracilis]
MLMASCFCYGQAKKAITDDARLNKCILENTAYFTFNGAEPAGEGWSRLENLFAQNQFVAWGEYHNSPLLSQLTGFALASASKNGYKTWCTETSPFAASQLTWIAKTSNPYDTIISFSKTNHLTPTFPFFESRADIQMLQTASKLNYRIWGIDQEFQLTFPYCISKIFAGVPNASKPLYKAVRDSLLAKWWMPDAKLLDSLRKVVKRPDLKHLIDEVEISRDIYNTGDSQTRATLMKRNFYNYFDALKSKNEKIFFKMGSNHLARGMNLETNLYDIGNTIFELSEHNGTGFANVYFMVRYWKDKDKVIDDIESDEHQNPKVFSRLYDREKWVTIDIRSLRRRIKNDGSLTLDTYKLIEKYDYVVISPEIL